MRPYLECAMCSEDAPHEAFRRRIGMFYTHKSREVASALGSASCLILGCSEKKLRFSVLFTLRRARDSLNSTFSASLGDATRAITWLADRGIKPVFV